MFSTIKYIYLPDCASSVQSFFIPSCCEFSPINQKSGEWTTPFPSFIPPQLQFYYNCTPRQIAERMTSSSHWSNTSIVGGRHFYGFAHFHTFMLTFQKSRATILGSSPASSTSTPGQADIGYKCPHLLLELTTLQRTFERFHSHSAWILPLILTNATTN